MPPTSPPQDRGAAPRVLGALLALALAAATWWLIRFGVSVGHTVDWSCFNGECSTNDWRALVPAAGIVCNSALAVTLAGLARGFGFGLGATVGPLAALSGWRAAIDAGVPPAEVATEQLVFTLVAAVAAAVALMSLVHELRVTGYGARLLGAQRVPAVLTDYGIADGDYGRVSDETAAASGFGVATLTFTANGRRHRNRVRVRRAWLDQRVFAVFRETRPERARVALAWGRSSSGTPEPAPEAAAGTPAAPSDSFVAELERLAALRTAGHLTHEEFEAAKRRLLG